MIHNAQLDSSASQIAEDNIKHKRNHQPESEMEHSINSFNDNKREVKSENPLPLNHPSLDHKTTLIKLMVKYKFERFGFRHSDLDSLIEQQLVSIENLDQVQAKKLADISTQIFLNIFASFIDQRRLIRHRLRPFQPENNSVIGLENNNQLNVHEENQHIENELHIHILCSICYNLTSHYVKEECGHQFCEECMRGYIEENIRENNYFIKCAEYDCRNLVSMQTIQKLLQNKKLIRFKYFRIKNEMELDPNNKFCSRPDCGELLQSLPQNKLLCPKCKQEFCQICLLEFHPGRQCDMVLKQTIHKTYSSLHIKHCPGCKSPIQKSDGCNHMTCKKCRFQFCWLCQKKYSHHHYRYYNCFGCPGMQFQNSDQATTERIRQIFLYLLLPIILSILLSTYLLIIPVYMVGCLIVKPCMWLTEENGFCENKVGKIVGCDSQLLSGIITWFLLQPRALIYSIFISPVKLTVMMCGEVCTIFE